MAGAGGLYAAAGDDHRALGPGDPFGGLAYPVGIRLWAVRRHLTVARFGDAVIVDLGPLNRLAGIAGKL